jgi:carboxyl-terminal processing protease
MGLALTAALSSFHGTKAQASGDSAAPAVAASTAEGVGSAATSPASDEIRLKNDDAAKKSEPADAARRLTDIRSQILKNFVRSADEQALDEAAIRGMLQSLGDPHSEFLSPEILKQFELAIDGELTGIGLELRSEEEQLVVITPLPGSPAQAAGLRPGDAILSVDGKSVAELGSTDAIGKIRGPAGSTVSLRVQKLGGGIDTLNVTRAAIRVPSVKGIVLDESGKWSFWLDRGQKLGYARISDFSKQTPDLLRTALNELAAEGLKGLVLDLRHCPGGLLASATEMAGLFLREGMIVKIKGEHTNEQVLRTLGKNFVGDFPLLVMVDEHTASAAEILAGALKENQRATLLGSRTFGKGSVQTVIRVDGTAAIRLTTAYFYLPDGRAIDRQPGNTEWGVDPSDGFFVPLTDQQETDRLNQQRRREVLAGPRQALPEKGDSAIAAALGGDFADPQLALAYKALAARVTSGAFTKVGRSAEDVREHYARRERLLKQRAEAARRIEEIDRELSTGTAR